MLALPGCGDNQDFSASLDKGFQNLFAPRRTPQQAMLIAVSSEDADERRNAVVRIAKSKDHNKEWAIKGFVAIALLESDPQTRCVAIRALARVDDPRAVETLLKILNYASAPAREVYPPDALARWDAADGLATLLDRGQVPENLLSATRTTLLDRLASDDERQARIAAARGLQHFADLDVVKALIAGLRDPSFPVAHQCEWSLVRLTGTTHDGDVQAWEEWLAQHGENAFAKRGELPDSRKPAYTNAWGKTVYETKELFNWLWPGAH